MTPREVGAGSVGIVLVTCIVALLVGFLVVPFILMVAWNIVVPAVFGGPTLSFLQALALYVVISIMTGGIRAGVRRN